jgi:hypothetical protein
MTDDEHARDVVINLIEGVRSAFDRDTTAPQTAENMLIRLAEALFPVSTFINQLPGLGHTYGNHFAELASALKDLSEGKKPKLLAIAATSNALPSQQSRARAHIVLAMEAVKKSGISFGDKSRTIKTIDEAAGEIFREITKSRDINQFGSADTFVNWRREFTRATRLRNEEAEELLEVGRAHMDSLRSADDLHSFARSAIKRARRSANWAV